MAPAPKTVWMSFARRRTRVILGIVVAIAVLTPFAMWLRDSSFVQVEQVTVTGIEGSQAPAIRRALTETGLDMSVLDVRDDALRTAVEPYPIVRSLRTSTDFPHGLKIAVNAYEPVAALQSGGQLVAVSADGRVLRGSATKDLAIIGVHGIPAGDRVTDPTAMRALRLLATAPSALRGRVARVYRGPRGLAATLQNGPKLYFGGTARVDAKWGAAVVVLEQRSSRGASYVDLRVPERPVAGGLQPRTPETQPQL